MFDQNCLINCFCDSTLTYSIFTTKKAISLYHKNSNLLISMISIKKSYLFVLTAITGFGVHATNNNVQQSQSYQQSTQEAFLQQKQTIFGATFSFTKKNTPLNQASLGSRVASQCILSVSLLIYLIIGGKISYVF